MSKTRRQRSVIGRRAIIRVAGLNYVGTVIDAAADRCKRIRIQSPGPRQGQVVQPSDYILLEFDDE